MHHPPFVPGRVDQLGQPRPALLLIEAVLVDCIEQLNVQPLVFGMNPLFPNGGVLLELNGAENGDNCIGTHYQGNSNRRPVSSFKFHEIDELQDGWLNIANQQHRSDAPEEGNSGSYSSLQVSPVVGIIPQFHVERLFEEQASKKLKDGRDDCADQKEGYEVAAEVIRTEDDGDNRKAVDGAVGTNQETPVLQRPLPDGTVNGFPEPANEGIAEKHQDDVIDRESHLLFLHPDALIVDGQLPERGS